MEIDDMPFIVNEVNKIVNQLMPILKKKGFSEELIDIAATLALVELSKYILSFPNSQPAWFWCQLDELLIEQPTNYEIKLKAPQVEINPDKEMTGVWS